MNKCDCGSASVNSSRHSDWCSTLKAPEVNSGQTRPKNYYSPIVKLNGYIDSLTNVVAAVPANTSSSSGDPVSFMIGDRVAIGIGSEYGIVTSVLWSPSLNQLTYGLLLDSGLITRYFLAKELTLFKPKQSQSNP
jgi:hypothetical protein